MEAAKIDVCVVGAGSAGLAVAQGLVRQGASVVLLDRLDPMPDCLKAEKFGGAGVQVLMRLGFEEALSAALTPLHNAKVYFGERSLGTVPLDPPEGAGLYHDFVNIMRAHLDPRVDFRRHSKVTAIEQHADGAEVIIDGGERISCRLVIMATGDGRHLMEQLGGAYEPQMPYDVFATAFTMEGPLDSRNPKVDSLTFNHPLPGSPVAYATFFRLGENLRANVFCPGSTSDAWQRDLKQRPLVALAGGNHAMAVAMRQWKVSSPVITRKVHVAKLKLPPTPRLLVLGDLAHTIDPAGGGGMVFAMLEVELALAFFLPKWLASDDFSAEAIEAFYTDPRRTGAVDYFFKRGEYIFNLNHDQSMRGNLRRIMFSLEQAVTSRRAALAKQPERAPGFAWPQAHAHLYDTYAHGEV